MPDKVSIRNEAGLPLMHFARRRQNFRQRKLEKE